MGRIPLLLILFAASLFAAVPAVADDSEASWQLGLRVSNADTVVSPDARYCLMPASMPIRPGNSVILRDAENHTIGTAKFADAVVVTPDPERFAADEPCPLIAKFQPIAPQDGLQVVIKPQPRPITRSPSPPVTIDVAIAAYGPFDWSYDDFGYKKCQPLGDVYLREGSPVVTSPVSRLYIGPNPERTRFNASVVYSEEKAEEYCLLVAALEFPVADEYIIDLGGNTQS